MKITIAVILCILLSMPVFGAFGAASAWYVDGLSGSDNNGGAFDSGVASPGTDESGTATAITVTLASGTTGTCSPACSSTTHGPGNFIRIASGAGCTTATTYEILSQAAGTITVDKAMGSATNVCVGVIGGPVQTISAASGKTVTGNVVNVKDSATYSIGAAITAISGGAGTTSRIRGYHTNPGDAGNCAISPTGTGCPVIQATAGSFTMYNMSNANGQIQNFVFDCNSQTSSSALTLSSNVGKATNITIKNCSVNGLSSTSAGGNTANNIWIHGLTSGCTAGLNVGANDTLGAVAIVAESNACTGIFVNNAASGIACILCVSANNTGATSDGFQIQTVNTGYYGILLVNCAAYKNARDGFRFTSTNGDLEILGQNNWAYGNTGKSFNASGGALVGTQQFNYNAYESGTLNNITAGPNDVTLTANPTVAGDSGNFALNVTSGGGIALKGTAFPGAIGSSVATFSIGPIQPLVNSSANVGGAFGFVQ